MHEKTGRKYPDRLAGSCKHSNVNWMVSGSRLSWCIMDFSPVCNFSSNILSDCFIRAFYLLTALLKYFLVFLIGVKI